MQVTTWSPLRDMEDLFATLRRTPGRSSAGNALADWEPAVDISETATEYLVKAELPGVAKDDVKLSVENGMLTLSGERRFEKSADKDAKQHRVERYYGTYSRSFSLPDDVQAEQISADYKDGVLSVHLPKAEAKKSRKVEVRVQ